MLWQGRLERHSHRTTFSKVGFVLVAQEQQTHLYLVFSAGIHGEGRGCTFCGHSMLHHPPAQPLSLWDTLTLMLPCLWEVSREITGEESVRNETEETFPWSLGLCYWAQPHLWDLSLLMPRSALFIPKSSVRSPLLFTTVPCLCPQQLPALHFSLMDQCELCSSGMQPQGSWNLDCFSK